MKVYDAPATIKTPDWNLRGQAYEADEQRYINEVKAFLQARRPGNALVGEIVYFGVADGSAKYMVASGTELIHLKLDDAYQIPTAHARGLRLADIKRMVVGRKKLNKLFDRKSA